MVVSFGCAGIYSEALVDGGVAMGRASVVAALLLTLVSPAANAQAIPILSRDLKDIEALARSDTNDAELQYYLALAYWRRNKWNQTDSLLRLAVRLEPRFAE